MTRRPFLTMLAALALVAAWPMASATAPEPAAHVKSALPLILPAEARGPVSAVAEQIICYCGCARQTVAACECGVADGLKRDIWQQLQSGKASAEVVASYVAEHGEEFRSMPQKKGLGLLAWALPWAAIVVAGAVLLPVVRRWSRPRPPASTGGAAPSAGDDAIEKQVDEEIRNLD